MPVGVFEEAFDGFVFELFFDGDDGGVGAELAGDVFDEFAFEGLVDSDEDALHQEGGDEVLAADVEFFGEVLDADTFGDRDGLGDGKRLTRDGRAAETRGRLEALHRAFFGLLVTLSATALAGTCGGAHAGRWGFAGAGETAGCSARTCTEAGTCSKGWTSAAGGEAGASGCSARTGWAAGEGAGRMHRATCAGSCR